MKTIKKMLPTTVHVKVYDGDKSMGFPVAGETNCPHVTCIEEVSGQDADDLEQIASEDDFRADRFGEYVILHSDILGISMAFRKCEVELSYEEGK